MARSCSVMVRREEDALYESAGTRLDPVTAAAAGSAHARGRKGVWGWGGLGAGGGSYRWQQMPRVAPEYQVRRPQNGSHP